MVETFRAEGVREVVSEVLLLEFECKDRVDMRRKIREIEASGPHAVPHTRSCGRIDFRTPLVTHSAKQHPESHIPWGQKPGPRPPVIRHDQ